MWNWFRDKEIEDFEFLRRFASLVIDMRLMRRAIASATILVGVIGVLMATQPSLVSPGWPRNYMGIVASTSVGAAYFWWNRGWPSFRVSLLWVLFSDWCIVTAVLLINDPIIAMGVSAELILVGVYVAYMHSIRTLAIQMVIASATVTVELVRALSEGAYPVGSIMAMGIAQYLGACGAPTLIAFNWAPARREVVRSLTDELTGLLTRRGLYGHLARMRPPDEAEHLEMMVALIDLDKFKSINDRFGHRAGDIVLQTVAERLAVHAPPRAVCSRIGGEEFVVVAYMPPSQALALGDLIVSAVHDPMDQYPVAASVGVVRCGSPNDYLSQTAVREIMLTALDWADAAMYRAKDLGGNCALVAETIIGTDKVDPPRWPLRRDRITLREDFFPEPGDDRPPEFVGRRRRAEKTQVKSVSG